LLVRAHKKIKCKLIVINGASNTIGHTEKFIHDYDKFAAPLIYSDVHCG